MSEYEKLAKEVLEILGKEDHIFSHHGIVTARPEAYKVLGKFFENQRKELIFSLRDEANNLSHKNESEGALWFDRAATFIQNKQ